METCKPDTADPSAIRILHLDDDPGSPDVAALLGGAGISAEVDRVARPEALKAALDRGGYALVLSDLHVAGFDRWEPLHLARSCCPEVPFVFFSATPGEEHAVEAIRRGASDYVLKSRPELLASAVRRALESPASVRSDGETETLRLELLRNERRLRVMFENVALGIAELGPDARIENVNPRFCDLLGYAREELLGRHIQEITAPEDLGRSHDLNGRILRGEVEVLRYEKRYRRKDGSRVWVHVTVSGVRDAAGRVARAVGTVEDISERKLAELAREQSEARLRRLYESGVVGLLFFDLGGSITDANDRFLQMVGYTREDLLAGLVRWQDMTPAEHAGLDRHAVQELRTTGVDTPYEKEFVRKDGSRVAVYIGAAMFDEPGEHGVAVVVDITDRRRSEEERRSVEERFRSVVENMSEGLMLFDAAGNLTYQNRASLRIHGFDPDGESRIAHEELRATWEAWDDTGRLIGFDEWPVSRVFRGERFQDQVLRVRRVETGQEFYGSYNGSPIPGPDGTLALGFITIRDITERVLAQTALRDANERLREADRRKDEFLGVLSHELRNPLAPIRNGVHVLERAAPGSEQARRALSVIDRQAGHLTRLVDDLLDVTRISRGKITLRRERLDLAELARRTAEDHRAPFAAGGVALAVDGARPVWVEGDPVRLAQIVGNLLTNAAKFTPAGGEARLTVGRCDRRARLEVRDSGAGMEAETLARLFEPFMQADQTLDRSRGGLGLGLALVKGLARMHGGDVEAASEGLGKGASFVVTLPLAAPTR